MTATQFAVHLTTLTLIATGIGYALVQEQRRLALRRTWRHIANHLIPALLTTTQAWRHLGMTADEAAKALDQFYRAFDPST